MTLHVNNLTVHHGAIQALTQVSFEVKAGELTAVIGSNGAGKSTLLRTLSGLKSATTGTATWKGHNLLHGKAESHVRHGVAHVSEGKSVIPELTVEENLDLGALWRRKKSESATTKREVFDLFPRLEERRKQTTETLSGGERQMLAIGRALMSKPELLLLDEPSLGLAPLLVKQIFEAIVNVTKQYGLSVVLVEQNAMGALNIADSGIVLNLGTIATTGSAQALASDPAVRAAYLGY
ncbi:MAG: ABC transporter ATP-binding protein [Candidatus Planktophila sp.]|nr:ABC transporter ATP-binding protein [Candidatus Planktophila sp.]